MGRSIRDLVGEEKEIPCSDKNGNTWLPPLINNISSQIAPILLSFHLYQKDSYKWLLNVEVS